MRLQFWGQQNDIFVLLCLHTDYSRCRLFAFISKHSSKNDFLYFTFFILEDYYTRWQYNRLSLYTLSEWDAWTTGSVHPFTFISSQCQFSSVQKISSSDDHIIRKSHRKRARERSSFSCCFTHVYYVSMLDTLYIVGARSISCSHSLAKCRFTPGIVKIRSKLTKRVH